ncbi:MAG: helix-turn-helix domain-containing protein [bacterium]
MSHIERKHREKEEIKQRIFAAARKIAQKEGWMSVTIRKIADEIEYAPPIVYEHFANKEDLFREIVYLGFDILGEGFNEAHAKEKDPKKLLKIISTREFDFAFANTDLYTLMFSLERPTPSDNMIKNINIIKGIFKDIANDDAEISKELFLTWIYICHGTLSIMLRYPEPKDCKDINKRDLFIKMLDRFINSM